MYKFIGIIKADYRYEYEPLPDNARLMVDRSKTIAIIAGFLGITVGYSLLLVKQYVLNNGEAVLNKPFILLGSVIGALLLLLHEFLHLIPYPENSTKIISITMMESITVGAKIRMTEAVTNDYHIGSTATILYIDEMDNVFIEWSDGKLSSFSDKQVLKGFEKTGT